MKNILLIISITSFAISSDIIENYKIEGMHCGYGCVNKVKTVLNSIEGVKKCDVNFEKSLMTVEFDEEKVNSDLIISSLSKNTTYRTSKVKEKDTNKESFWSKLKGIFNKKS